MDQRRQILIIVMASCLFMVWMTIAPVLFPWVNFPGQKPKQAANVPAAQNPVDPANPDAPAPDVVNPEGPKPDAVNPPGGNAAPLENPQPAPAVVELPRFPRNSAIVLGDTTDAGAASGYLLKAELSTQGGAVNWVRLTDDKRTRDNPYTYINRPEMIKVVGDETQRNLGGDVNPRSFETSFPIVDKQLAKHGQSLTLVDWEIVQQTSESVTFRYPAPEGGLEIVKKYTVPKVDPAGRDADPAGYLLRLDITIRNTTAAPVKTSYNLLGPVGLPLEDPENTRLFREVKIGTLPSIRYPNRVTSLNMLARDLVKQTDAAAQPNGDPVLSWREPIQYAGVDCQFFAALIVPRRNQLEDVNKDGQADPDFISVKPELLLRTVNPDRSNLTIKLESAALTIPANGEVTHSLDVFLGPKRPELLQPLKADRIMQLGQFLFGEWSWVAAVSKLMLSTLNIFHKTGLPYAFCIILLTVIVRGLMLPISRKQVVEAEKMRVLAPELKKIQDQHKNDPEQFARAYRDFQKRHNYHPMAGCLPSLLQLPIFIGLYNALYHAMDLRMAQFLWVENLAGPDALAQLGFRIPWFGWTEFNLLPFLTVGLMLLQQKLFTPPPTSDEQAMQMRMMNVMMLFIGFAFYRVPAGLCLYFIASSLWGVAERTLLAKHKPVYVPVEGPPGDGTPGSPLKPEIVSNKSNGPKVPGWIERMLEAADKARNPNDPSSQSAPRKFSKDKRKKG